MTAAIAAVWTDAERQAWAIERRVPASRWAQEHWRISPKYAQAEKYDLDETPYIREILDALSDQGTRRVTVMKATQVGFTESLFAFVGYCIDHDPGPMLYVMPSENEAKVAAGARLKAGLQHTPKTAEHITERGNDLRGDEWHFDSMLLRRAWPTPGQLGSTPFRFVIMDEIDKFERTTGKEANPITLATDRTDRFPNRKIVVGSTPVDEHGHLAAEWELSTKERFWVPCPKCGEYQPLAWSRVRYKRGEEKTIDCDPEAIRADQSAWYECVGGCRIEEIHKARMLRSCVACPDGLRVLRDGTLDGDRPRSTHRGFYLPSLYSLTLTWSDMAAEWVECARSNDATKLQNFVNSRLAEFWREKEDEVEANSITDHALPYARGTVPEDVLIVAVGVDVQKDHVWWTCRGYSPTASYLLEYGRIDRYTDALELPAGLDEWHEIESRLPNLELVREDTGEIVHPQAAMIDSGAFTDAVYTLCRRNAFFRPVKGTTRADTTTRLRASREDRRADGKVPKRGGLTLWWVNSDYYKTAFSRRLGAAVGSPGAAYVFEGVGDDYVDQITAEELVPVRDKNGRVVRRGWKPRPGRNANHLLDCEVYAAALADTLGANRLTPEHLERARARRAKAGAKRPAPAEPAPTGKPGRGQRRSGGLLDGVTGRDWFGR